MVDLRFYRSGVHAVMSIYQELVNVYSFSERIKEGIKRVGRRPVLKLYSGRWTVSEREEKMK
jgi:hypothetical protein